MSNLAQKYASFISKQIKNQEISEGLLGTRLPHSLFDEHVNDLMDKHGLHSKNSSMYDNDNSLPKTVKLSNGNLGSKHHIQLTYKPDGRLSPASLDVSIHNKKNQIFRQSIAIKNKKHLQDAFSSLDGFVSDMSKTLPFPTKEEK